MKKIRKIKNQVVTYEDGSFSGLELAIQSFNNLVGAWKNMEMNQEIYDRYCAECACENECHENCDFCDKVLEAMEEQDE